MTTILDVARHVDVSVRTVSRVLNDDPRVRPHTRKMILESMESLGFLPSQAARSLAKSRSRTIGLVLFNFNAAQLELVPGIEEVVREREYSLLVCDSQSDRAIEAANLRRLYEHRVEGLVVLLVSDQCPELALFARQGIPVMAIHYVPMPDLPLGVGHVHVLAGAQEAPRLALRYFVELGHRRIAVVEPNRPLGSPLYAFRDAMIGLGIEYDPSLEIVCNQPPDCPRAVAALLARADRPTALFSRSHAFCPYVLEGIQASGLAVPDELSFVTTGDSPWARVCQPPLTTVSYDIIGHSRLMAEYIFARIDGKPAEEVLGAIGPVAGTRLIIRRSCAPPAANPMPGLRPEVGSGARRDNEVLLDSPLAD